MRLIFALGCQILLMSLLSSAVFAQQPEDVPPPVPLLSTEGYDLENILLLGSDTANPNNSGRTDVILIVSVNRTANTIALLSIPRDLYVYIPGWRTYRINSAYGHGEQVETGYGPTLLMETIRYNLGLEIDHFARIDFGGFKYLVDAVGGVELSVDCGIQDWRLLAPDLDPSVEANWTMFTLPVGLHTMDGDLALWYVRSRRTSSDFDRGRRQQDMLRALWWRVRDLGLIQQIPEIWGQIAEIVETDLTLQDVLGILPIALQLDNTRLSAFRLQQNRHTRSTYTDNGESVQIPINEEIASLLHTMLIPPTDNQLVGEIPRIEIVNATSNPDMGRVAADRLAWEGFQAILSGENTATQRFTTIYDYTGLKKTGSLDTLQAILRVADEAVVSQPTADREVDYRVVLGTAYYACTYNVLPPDLDDD